MSARFTFLHGEHLVLRPLLESDADGPYPGWLNDAEVCQGNSHHVLPYTPQTALEYIRRTQQSPTDLVLAIVLKENDTHVGNIALQSIHSLHRCAEFAILIGNRSAWGKGHGLEAGRLLCRHGFHALNLHRIHCGTYAGNAGMIALARALGMKEEGRRREAAYKDGHYVDIVEFGLIGSDFL